jgi:hypothetical protein
MGKKLVPLALVLLVALGIFFISRSFRHGKAHPRPDTYGPYKLTKLPDGVIAKAGNIEVPTAKVHDAVYNDMIDRQNGLLAALAYDQILAANKFTRATFGFTAPSRPLHEICAIYNVTCADQGVSFDAKQKELLNVDGKTYGRSNLDLDHIAWYALQTEIYNHLIQTIRAEIRLKAFADLAMREKVASQELLETKIMAAKDVEAAARAEFEKRYGAVKSIPPDLRPKFTGLVDQVRNRAIDDYLERHGLQLPILVDVELPDANFDMKWDWVAHIGDRKSRTRVIFVSDFFSESAQQLISRIPEYSKKWPHVVFGFRPAFGREDRYQLMVADMAQCVWKSHYNRYWDFLRRVGSLSQEQNDFEPRLYKILAEIQIDSPQMRACFVSRKYKDAVEYHIQWAEYERILAGPVAIIGREVYIGPVDEWVLGDILSRQ